MPAAQEYRNRSERRCCRACVSVFHGAGCVGADSTRGCQQVRCWHLQECSIMPIKSWQVWCVPGRQIDVCVGLQHASMCVEVGVAPRSQAPARATYPTEQQ